MLTVALRAREAWSLLNPMETMVARCSSDTLSVGVDPGAELEPGNTKGAAKSAANHVEAIKQMGPVSKKLDWGWD